MNHEKLCFFYSILYTIDYPLQDSENQNQLIPFINKKYIENVAFTMCSLNLILILSIKLQYRRLIGTISVHSKIIYQANLARHVNVYEKVK